MKKQIVHYWMMNCYAACGCSLVKDTVNKREVTCKRCRKTKVFRKKPLKPPRVKSKRK